MTSETLTETPRPRLRRLAVAAVGVTAVTAAVLLPGASASADPVVGKPVEQPEYPIPDLPPLGENEKYEWLYFLDEGKDSEAAAKYGDAFYEWFDATVGVELPQRPPVQVFDNEIWVQNHETGEGRPTGESLPVYSLSAMDLGGGWTGPLNFTAPGREVADVLRLEIRPKASFKEGGGETFEYLANCEDTEDQADGMTMLNDHTCTEAEGPDGERLLFVETVRSEKDSGDVYSKRNTAILYRADGTAVTASDSIPGFDHSEYPLDPSFEPYLGVADLAEQALSMPDVIVEG